MSLLISPTMMPVRSSEGIVLWARVLSPEQPV
jgi:hypothetical protein